MALSAPLNVFPLSEMTRFGKPLRATNLLKLRMNESVLKSVSMSRCTARVAQQVYKQIHVFSGFFTYRGPAKSTPMLLNANASFTRHSGKGGGAGQQ